MPPDQATVAVDPLSRLSRLGVTNWKEVLLCVPKSFIDYSKMSTIQQALQTEDDGTTRHLFRLTVTEAFWWRSGRLHLSVTDGIYPVRICIFATDGDDVPRWKSFLPGDIIYLLGNVHVWDNRAEITGPLLVPPHLIGQIIPVYEKRRGVVAEGAIFTASRYALNHHVAETIDYLSSCYHGLSEKGIIARARLRAPSFEVVLRAAHAPMTEEEGYRGVAAMKRLAALSIVENAKRLRLRTPMPSSIVKIPASMINELIAMLPYRLTSDQRVAIDDIVKDLASPIPMRRVLSGDVGCGKTLCFLIPALATQRLGRLAVILAPNVLLVDQLAKECKQFFGESTKILVVTSKTKKLDLTDNPILVGTTALLSRLKNHAEPAFFAVDEQQKFSVGQKAELAAINSNLIESTATPIPRTTALITHGASTISIIRQNPVEKTILTKIVGPTEAKRLFDHTRKVVENNHQVAIVYPIVNNPEKEKKSVTAAFELWNSRFPGQVAMIHGQMKEEEKLEAIAGLKRGDQKICVSSTVVEIGLTLPSLRSLIVVNAERYGTSTLHQLRGRVARLGGIGYFFLFLPDPVSEDSMKRMCLLEEFSDGFILSEKDAELRGYGDLFENAERQSGGSRSTVFHCVDLTPADIHRISSPLPMAA